MFICKYASSHVQAMLARLTPWCVSLICFMRLCAIAPQRPPAQHHTSAVFGGVQGGTSGGKGVQRDGGDVSTAPGASKTDLAKDEVDRAAEEYSYNSTYSAKDPNPRFFAKGDRGTKLTVRASTAEVLSCECKLTLHVSLQCATLRHTFFETCATCPSRTI